MTAEIFCVGGSRKKKDVFRSYYSVPLSSSAVWEGTEQVSKDGQEKAERKSYFNFGMVVG